jgi:hypothetical protein
MFSHQVNTRVLILCAHRRPILPERAKSPICLKIGGSYHLGASRNGPAHPARKPHYAPVPTPDRTDPMQGAVNAGPVVASKQPYLRNRVVSFDVSSTPTVIIMHSRAHFSRLCRDDRAHQFLPSTAPPIPGMVTVEGVVRLHQKQVKRVQEKGLIYGFAILSPLCRVLIPS